MLLTFLRTSVCTISYNSYSTAVTTGKAQMTVSNSWHVLFLNKVPLDKDLFGAQMHWESG